MKYCTHCGKQLFDEAVVCPGCGCPAEPLNNFTGGFAQGFPAAPSPMLLGQLSQRLKVNAIIWICIGALQLLFGVVLEWWVTAVVGGLNIASAVGDITYSKEILTNPKGIVAKFEPVTEPIITLAYNLVIGGVVGVIGSVYYFLAIRNFVMENKASFAFYDNTL